MEITFTESSAIDRVFHSIVGTISNGSKTHTLYLSRGRNRKNELRFFISGLGRRVAFAAANEKLAAEKAVQKIKSLNK